jgi:dynein heavy chain
VLGTSDPTSIQEHMLKLFDNCVALHFGEKAKTVTGMKSSEGETFNLRMKVNTETAVEIWMKCVEAEMRSTLFDIMKEGLYHYAKSRRQDWIYENLGMVTLVSSTEREWKKHWKVMLALCVLDTGLRIPIYHLDKSWPK